MFEFLCTEKKTGLKPHVYMIGEALVTLLQWLLVKWKTESYLGKRREDEKNSTVKRNRICTEETSSDYVVSYYTDERDFNGVWGEFANMGEGSNNIFHVKLS